ncbi:hypothetical protein [Streptomyces griseoluteus]|uniref:hypothetical protein n=1 Tax=Streptomyces griseoluteus TaxID=29306 RepID=UPI0036885057
MSWTLPLDRVRQRAGRDRLLLHARAPEEGTPGERVRGIVDGFVSFVRRWKDTYVAVVRAAAGGDEGILEVSRTTAAS